MIFGEDRSQLRRFYLEAWRKRRSDEPLEPLEAMVAQVVEQHPEYHHLLTEEVLDHDFTPESGRSNPFLHMGMHISLAEQVAADRPAGIRELYRRITAACGDPHEAEHRMMECLGTVLWEAQRRNRPPDERAYLECLGKLLG